MKLALKSLTDVACNNDNNEWDDSQVYAVRNLKTSSIWASQLHSYACEGKSCRARQKGKKIYTSHANEVHTPNSDAAFLLISSISYLIENS